MILIGFVLSLMGVALPFLMLIHVVQSTFFLNFFSFFASISGLILGIIRRGLIRAAPPEVSRRITLIRRPDRISNNEPPSSPLVRTAGMG